LDLANTSNKSKERLKMGNSEQPYFLPKYLGCKLPEKNIRLRQKCDEIHLAPCPMKKTIYSKKFYNPFPISKINQFGE
jgi:hypothetical protein